jgi:hypothetical protein
MKWLFLLLLTVNIAIFAWGYQLEQRPQPILEAGGDVGNMRLISELTEEEASINEEESKQEPAPATEAQSELETAPQIASTEEQPEESTQDEPQEESNKPAMPGDVSRCGIIGPLKDRQVAKEVMEDLKKSELEAKLERSIKKEQIGYWVVIPPMEDGSQAQAKIDELAQVGLKDIWHFRGGGMKNAISLGMFSKKENAENFSKEVLAKGFETEMRPRYLNKTSYLVKFSITNSKTVVDNLWGEVEKKYSKMPFTKQSCE